MMDAAKTFESEDKQKRDEIELHNQADTAVFTAEKMVKRVETNSKRKTSRKSKRALLREKKRWLMINLEEIKKSMEALTEAVYAVTTKIYQKVQAEQAAQQQPAGAGAPPNPESKDEDNVVNADYKVKEE